ncbi:MAG TPA: SLBB domain-containing protein [Ktedonobacterales bacterium]
MMADRLGDMLRSRYYRPVMFGLLFILLLGLWVAVLNRNGDWPPAFLQPRPSIAITGPGVGSNAQIQAYVLGAVRTPGVYTLPQGSRVHDLIAAAGGALTTADLSRVNLAAVLADGQSIYVPLTGEDIPFERGGKVDINVATAQQMHNALGITLTTARHIVAYRAAHGDFTAVSQLLLVPVSRDIYDRIKDLVTV